MITDRRQAVAVTLCLTIVVLLGNFSIAASVWALEPGRKLTQYLHRIWQVPQGLPQAAVFAIHQSRQGYLWLGTQTGIVRFDGVRFTALHERHGVALDNVWVNDIIEDDAEQLWLATANAGVIRLGRDDAQSLRVANGLPAVAVNTICIDARGDVWAATTAGIAKLANNQFVTPAGLSSLRGVNIRGLASTSDGRLWIVGDGNQLNIWDGQQLTARKLTRLPANATINAVQPATAESTWLATSEGLLKLTAGEEQLFTHADGLADDNVLTLAAGQDGVLWAGTKDGFSRWQNGEFQSFRSKDGLSQSTVYAIAQDREGSLWVGTKHGLNQFLDRRTIPFTTSEGLPSNETGPIVEDRDSTVWVGTLGAGLSHFDGRQFTVFSTEHGLPSNQIIALATDDAGLWIGTTAGVCRWIDGHARKTWTTNDGLPVNDVRCLAVDRAGILWAGTAAGLARLVGDRFEQPAIKESQSRAPIAALIARRDHSLIVSHDDGSLERFVDGEFVSTIASTSGEIAAFYEDQQGLLWMGLRHGGLQLVQPQPGRAVTLTIADGLYDDEIYGIAADDAGRLWMACSKGVFSVARDDLLQFAAGTIKSFQSTPFSPTDALRTIECRPGVQPGICRTGDGRIWFSTIRGLIVIDPNKLERKHPPPPVLVEEVLVNGRGERPSAVQQLPPGSDNLSFRYTALSLLSPTRITFQYRLSGYDHDWVEAGARREAFYTNLPPGNYRFEVRACNIEGKCYDAQPLALVLAPHFYQRGWFWPLGALCLAIVVWSVYRLRVRRMREQWRAVLAERSRIGRELHDTLMQGFSGVTMEMQALVAQLPESEHRATLDEIIHDAGSCLREARLSVAGLRSTTGQAAGLAAAIAQAAKQIGETRDVHVKLELTAQPLRLSSEAEYNLLRIAQEALTNAVKHSGARNVEITLEATPRGVRLAVQDDGAGFDCELATATQAPDNWPGHYGLIGMRERAAQIGAELRVRSQPGRGALVEVLTPSARATDAAQVRAAVQPTETP